MSTLDAAKSDSPKKRRGGDPLNDHEHDGERGKTAGTVGVLSVAALSAALTDLLHELGHAASTALPVGVRAVTISTIGLSSTGKSAVVAAAGPVANLLLSLFLLLAFAPRISSPWRYFAWLFGTGNLFNATAYLVYSAILGSGDWATVFDALAAPAVWRPLVGVAGFGLYAASVFASLTALRSMIASGVVAKSNARRYCVLSWWCGGILLTVGAVFNPVGPWFILTSGAATGFGAMAGLLLLPERLRRSVPAAAAGESLVIGWPWIAAGFVAAAVFIGVFGPGVRLSP